jgi:pilus assembly protein CpaE
VSEIARKDFEHSIERQIDMVLPYDAKVATQAAKLGKTIAESGRASKLGQAFLALSKLIASSGPTESIDKVTAKKGGGSLISRLLEVKLPKPKGKAKAEAAGELVGD